MSENPEQNYFSEGISEDITTELSRFHSIFVISRNSAFAYLGKAVDVRQVGRELGVEYIVEGSFRNSGKRVRVTAQLIEVAKGHHIWAERYDRNLEDIFEVQDEITETIVSTLYRQNPEQAFASGPRVLQVYAANLFLEVLTWPDLPGFFLRFDN